MTGSLDPCAVDYRLIGADARRVLERLPELVRVQLEALVWQQLPKPHDDEWRTGWRNEDFRMRAVP